MAIKKLLENDEVPTSEDHLRARRRRDAFVAWVCGVLSGPGSRLPKQCQRSEPMEKIGIWIREFGAANEFRPSAMRKFLEGKFTDGKHPIYIPKQHRKEVELILDVLDVVETLYELDKILSSGLDTTPAITAETCPEDEGKLPDPVIAEFLEENPPDIYEDEKPVADQVETEPPEAEKEKPVAKEPESGNTPVEGVVKPEQAGNLPDAEGDHDPYEKLPPEPKKLGRPPNPKESGPPPEPKKIGRPLGSGKKKT